MFASYQSMYMYFLVWLKLVFLSKENVKFILSNLTRFTVLLSDDKKRDRFKTDALKLFCLYFIKH